MTTLKVNRKLLSLLVILLVIWIAYPFIIGSIYLRGDIIGCLNANKNVGSNIDLYEFSEGVSEKNGLWFIDHSFKTERGGNDYIELLSYSVSVAIFDHSTKPTVCVRNNSDYDKSKKILNKFSSYFDKVSLPYEYEERRE